MSQFANWRSQLLLDRLGKCLKQAFPLTSSRRSAQQFCTREKHPKTRGIRVARASVYLNEPATGHNGSPATRRKEALTASRLRASDPSNIDKLNGDGGVRARVHARGAAVSVHLTMFLLSISVRMHSKSLWHIGAYTKEHWSNIGRNAWPNKLLFSASQMVDVFLHRVPLYVFREHQWYTWTV